MAAPIQEVSRKQFQVIKNGEPQEISRAEFDSLKSQDEPNPLGEEMIPAGSTAAPKINPLYGQAILGGANVLARATEAVSGLLGDPQAAHETYAPAVEFTDMPNGLQGRPFYDPQKLAYQAGGAVTSLAGLAPAMALGGPVPAAIQMGAQGAAEQYQAGRVADDPNAGAKALGVGAVDTAAGLIGFGPLTRVANPILRAGATGAAMAGTSVPQAGANALITGQDPMQAMQGAVENSAVPLAMGAALGLAHPGAPARSEPSGAPRETGFRVETNESSLPPLSDIPETEQKLYAGIALNRAGYEYVRGKGWQAADGANLGKDHEVAYEAIRNAPVAPQEAQTQSEAPLTPVPQENAPQAPTEPQDTIQATPEQPQPQPETSNGKEAADETQGQGEAAQDVLNGAAGGESATQVPPPAPSLESLTWNELTAKSEEANRSRDMDTLKAVLDEVKARRSIGSSGPRVSPTVESSTTTAPESDQPVQPITEIPNEEKGQKAKVLDKAAGGEPVTQVTPSASPQDVTAPPATPTPTPESPTLKALREEKERADTEYYGYSNSDLPENVLDGKMLELFFKSDEAAKAYYAQLEKEQAPNATPAPSLAPPPDAVQSEAAAGIQEQPEASVPAVKPKRTPPAPAGKPDAEGWTRTKGTHAKEFQGAQLAVAKDDAEYGRFTASVDGQVVSSHDSVAEARKAAEQEVRDRANEAEQTANQVEAETALKEAATYRQYHGSSRPIDELGHVYDRPQHQNLYGPGFYTTSDREIAGKYTKKGKGREPSVYGVEWLKDNPPNLLDLDKPLPKEAFDVIQGMAGQEDWAKLDPTAPGTKVYDDFREILSDMDIPTYEAQDYMSGVTDELTRLGYDGFKHVGGKIVGKKDHNVEIYFDPTDPQTGKPNIRISPADTGIFRDLTAAARAGQRFVEDLHVRIAPTLARIHAAAKSAADFVKQAVAKIGEHVRPYARRFLSDLKVAVKNTNERGISGEESGVILNPFKKGALKRGERKSLANPATEPPSREFVEKVDVERGEPSPETRAQWEQQASALDGEEVMNKLRAGETFQTPAEVIRGKRITDETAWNAIYTGEGIQDAWHVADSWRKTGTAAARILGARFDPILSASDRAKVTKANADISNIDRQLDEPSLTDEQHKDLLDQRAAVVQSVNDIKLTGTARRMLAEIFTSPRKATDRKLKDIDKKLEEPTLSPADRKRLEARREKLSNSEGKALERMRQRMVDAGVPLNDPIEMRKRDNILLALNEARAHKSTFTDKMEELYKNMLFSASTPKNVLANTAMFAHEYAAVRPIEALLNKAFKIDSRAAKPSDFKQSIAAFSPAIRRGVRNMIDSWRTEADMFELQTHGPNMNISGKLEARGAAIPGKIGRAVRAAGYRPLTATDSFNKSVIAELEVAAFANRLAIERGLKGRERDRFIQRQTLDYESPSWRHAVGVAEELTLTDPSGKAIRGITQLRDASPILRFLLPVIRTPAKELGRALRATPLGTLNIAHKLYSDPTYTRARLARDSAEQAAAWTLAIGLYSSLNIGDRENTELPTITGNRPYNPKRKAENDMNALVAPARSIRMGNRWYSYNGLGQVGSTLAYVVDGLESLGKAKSDGVGALAEAMTRFMGAIKDQSFLSNIGDIMDAFEEGGMQRWATDFAASWSPAVVKRSARAMDQQVRDTSALDAEGKLNYKIFPSESQVPAKVDLFGREVDKAQTFGPRGDFLFRVMGNTDVVDMGQRTPFENDLYRMILNWNNQHPDERWMPGVPALDYVMDGKRTKWTPEQYHDVSVEAGKFALEILADLDKEKAFNYDHPTEDDKRIVTMVLRDARERAKGLAISDSTATEKPAP